MHLLERNLLALQHHRANCPDRYWSVGETVRRERRWISAGATPARELVRSTAAPIGVGPFSPASSFHSARRDRCLMGYADQMDTGSAARGFDPLRVGEL